MTYLTVGMPVRHRDNRYTGFVDNEGDEIEEGFTLYDVITANGLEYARADDLIPLPDQPGDYERFIRLRIANGDEDYDPETLEPR